MRNASHHPWQSTTMNSIGCAAVAGLLAILELSSRPADSAPAASWTAGAPIVTYWCGPSMTDAVAQQMAEGGWNLVWCGEKDLDVVHRHGLRGQLQDSLLSPASLDDPRQREKLDALIARVRQHPALYAYFITDEPSVAQFPALGRLVAYLRERDPARLAYINLFPTYANNEQLGTKGDAVTAYKEHLRLFIEQRHVAARRGAVAQGRRLFLRPACAIDELQRSRTGAGRADRMLWPAGKNRCRRNARAGG